MLWWLSALPINLIFFSLWIWAKLHLLLSWSTDITTLHAGIILCMCPANEGQRYIVTSSPISWAHTQNDGYTGDWFLFTEFLGPIKNMNPIDYTHAILQFLWDFELMRISHSWNGILNVINVILYMISIINVFYIWTCCVLIKHK